MIITLPAISSCNSKMKKGTKTNRGIQKWIIFSLCIITILVVVAILKTILPLLFFGLILAFIWSQATKPIAQLEKEQKSNGQQLNLFHQKLTGNKNPIHRIEEEKEERKAA